MQVVLWDTNENSVQKDYAGGMGTGLYRVGVACWIGWWDAVIAATFAR